MVVISNFQLNHSLVLEVHTSAMGTVEEDRPVAGGSRGGSEVSTEPPFLAGYVINLICTVKDPGFMEPPFLPFS